MGDREGAGKAFEAVIASEPTSIDALRGLAALAVEREDLDKALDLQAKLIEVGERTPELFYNTGLLLQKSGQFEDAIRLYQEALAEKPDFAEALLNLGHALKAQGKPDEARNCWRQALEQKPELAAGYFEQYPYSHRTSARAGECAGRRPRACPTLRLFTNNSQSVYASIVTENVVPIVVSDYSASLMFSGAWSKG